MSGDSRLELLAARHRLDRTATERLELLAARLADPEAPTAIRDRARIINDHLADSLVALDLPEVREAQIIGDLGSGAGVPALVLAIARPEAVVFAIESTGRKCEFIRGAALACALDNVTVVHARAEEWFDGVGRLDLVCARALAPLNVVAEYAAPLLRGAGALLAWRGRIDPGEDAAGRRAADQLGLAWREPLAVVPYRGAVNRHLQLLVKDQVTPAGFPRRPGMARKRPLGA